MYTSESGQVLGAAALGGTGLTLLGVPVQTSTLIAGGVLVILLASYVFYKFRNRNLR